MSSCLHHTSTINGYLLAVISTGQTKVLYDFSVYEPLMFALSTAIMLTLLIFEIAVFYLNPEYRYKKILGKTPLVFVAVFVTIACLLGGLGNSIRYFKLNDIYNHQTYHVVEGKVENFRNVTVKHSVHEQFEINGIKFSLAGNTMFDHYGYDRMHVVQNDIPLKIYYCEEWGQNTILHIEILYP